MRVWLETDGGPEVVVNVEVARDPRTIEQGLAGRRSIDEDNGMLFVFDTAENRPMWMRNVEFPLDMIFIREIGFSRLDVIGIVHHARPFSLDRLYVGQPSLYVLEVNGGWCERNGVGSGARVRFG